MIELLLFGSFFVFLFLGVPVAFSLGLAAVTVLVVTDGIQSLDVVPSIMYPSMSSGTLLAIPFFVLTGIVMQHTGISQRLVDLAFLLFGRFSHGMAVVTIVSAFFFAAISGSGPATVAAIGTILIPALVNSGYSKKHSSSLVAAAGSMGIVVPPSIAFIVFAVVVSDFESVSISRLFIAGIIPGVLLALGFFIATLFVPRVREAAGRRLDTLTLAAQTADVGMEGTSAEAPAGGPGRVAAAEVGGDPAAASGAGSTAVLTATAPTEARQKTVGTTFIKAIPGLLIPVIILGGIYGGIFTPTEAGAVASVYALLVGVLVYRELPWGKLPRVFLEAGVSTATIMFIVGLASVFSYVITVEGVAGRVSEAVLSVTDNKILILIAVTVLLLIAGAFVDAISAFYLLIPIIVPILLTVGVDITTIGVFMTVSLAIGLFTPPVGLNLFVAAGISKSKLEDLVSGIWPFVIAAVAVLMLIVFVPALSNWLPDLLGVS